MYKIQAGRYGTDWEDFDGELYLTSYQLKNLDALSTWIAIVENLETHERYNYRILDDEGKVRYHQCMPFDPAHVNIADESNNWLDDVRAGYGIDEDVWAKACRVYLNFYDKEHTNGPLS